MSRCGLCDDPAIGFFYSYDGRRLLKRCAHHEAETAAALRGTGAGKCWSWSRLVTHKVWDKELL